MNPAITEVFLQLFCEKNSDGTKSLRLQGRELFQRKKFRIEDADMFFISNFLRNDSTITKMDLCYNNVGDPGIEFLAENYINSSGNLAHLNLVGCNITDIGAKLLGNCACFLKGLKTLRLTGNKLGSKGAEHIAKLLDNTFLNLVHLDVGDCDHTLGSIPHYTGMLRSDIGGNRSLQVFDLSRVIPSHCMYQFDGAQLADHIGEMIKMNSTLKELHLQKCQLDGHDVEILLYGLWLNTTLLLLDLAYNNVGDLGVDHIAKWLISKPELMGLNLAGNKIGSNGATTLSMAMPSTRIRLLDLSDNQITDDGLCDLLKSVKKPIMLRRFFIWGNQFDQPSLTILMRLFEAAVFAQENLDVKPYAVDDVIHVAHYPIDHYKQRYYCVQTKGVPEQLRIRRNKVDPVVAHCPEPRLKMDFQYYDRIPPKIK